MVLRSVMKTCAVLAVTALLGSASIATTASAASRIPALPFEELDTLLRDTTRHLRTAAATAEKGECADAAANSPFKDMLQPIPETMGLRNCAATNLGALTGALNDQCTLSSLSSLFSSTNTELASVKQLFGALMAGVNGTEGAASITTLLTSWSEDASSNEGFCDAMNSLVGPCAEALVPAIVKLMTEDAECCDGLKPVGATLKAFVPPGKTIDATLFGLVNGVHRMMCSSIGSGGALCGQRLFGFLADIFAPEEDKSLFGPLFFEAGLPLYALPSGSDTCDALDSGEISNQVSNKEGSYKYFSYSCCASGMAAFWEALDEIIETLTGNSVPELLNLVIAREEDAERRFAARYEDIQKCKFEETCKDPAFVLKAPSSSSGLNADKKAAASKSIKAQDLKCKEVQVCDKEKKVCSTVCEEGSAIVAPWVERAVAYQRNVSYTKSLCYTQLPGTHNSGTTLARGYGNRDQLANQFQNPEDVNAYVRTNNQVLTLTDQLQLGARFLELDTHYFSGKMHSGHCSRINLSFLDLAFEAMVTEIEKLLTNGGEGEEAVVEWGPWLMGCLPSLSGIRAEEQREHMESIKEVAAWMKNNPSELLMLYTEIGREVYVFEKLDELLEMYTDAFGDMLFTPSDFEAMGGDWDAFTLADLIAKGKRIIPIATPEPNNLMFKLDDLCDGLVNVPVPTAKFPEESPANAFWGYEMQSGKFVRAYRGILRYGGFAESILSGKKYKQLENQPVEVDAETLSVFTAAGVNILAPDAFDGAALKGMVWSWAEREPSRGDTVAGISADDGRWYGMEDKFNVKYVACVSLSDRKAWSTVAQGKACPEGSEKGTPSNGQENALLVLELRKRGSEAYAELAVDVSSLPIITEEEEKKFEEIKPGKADGADGKPEGGNAASSLTMTTSAWVSVGIMIMAVVA